MVMQNGRIKRDGEDGGRRSALEWGVEVVCCVFAERCDLSCIAT
jgi:hypothetical protein